MDMIEGMHMEFKREYTVDIRKEIVAFANSQGGTIWIGVADNGEVAGLSNPDDVLLRVVSMTRDAIKPDVTLFTKCETAVQDGKNVVKVEVQRGTDRPYYIADKGLKPSGVYVRSGSASVPASQDGIRAMIKETDGDKYESGRSLNQDLSFITAKEEFARRKLEFGVTQMKTLGLIGEDGLYTNLALLLSDQCQHTIKAAVFQGNSKAEFKDRREFGGSLLGQLISAYEYIDQYNKVHATIEGLLRVDRRDYPEIAIRETLLNAVVHREYSFSGSTLISIFDNRIEMVTLGGLVPGLSLEAIKIGASQSRNERLSNIFYRLRLIEAYGTGIRKIMDSYAGQPMQPDFIVTDGAFSVVLPNLNEQKEIAPAKTKNLTPNAEKALGYIREHGDVSRQEIEEFLGIKQTAAGNLLRGLVKQNLIETVGGGKTTTYRIIEYVR